MTRRTLLGAICSTPFYFGAQADFEHELEKLRAKYSVPGLAAGIYETES